MAANTIIDDPLAPVPMPEQAPATDGFAQLPVGRIWYRDSGGAGVPIVFLHPAASGDPLLWGYQQPFFVKAGYRVITYARRSYYKSDRAPQEHPGNAAEDLGQLLKALNLPRAHIVSSGAGGSVAADHALTHPDQVRTLTVSSNYAGVRSGYIYEAAQRARVKQWNELPRWYREFSTSYIVANPDGLKRWMSLQEEATKGKGIEQESYNLIDEAKLGDFKVPVFLLTGDADSSTPPSLMRMLARHIPDVELTIVPETGHSPYWERPGVFNHALLDFLRKH